LIEDPIEQVKYMLPELFILAFILYNNIYIQLIGMEATSETEVEDIVQAIKRNLGIVED